MIEDAIVALLERDDQLTELVGTRIFPEEAPQGATMPYVTYSIAEGDYDVAGARTVEASLQLDAYARFKSVAKQVAVRLREIHLTRTISVGVPIDGIFFEDGQADILPPQDGSGQGIHLIGSTFQLWYER